MALDWPLPLDPPVVTVAWPLAVPAEDAAAFAKFVQENTHGRRGTIRNQWVAVRHSWIRAWPSYHERICGAESLRLAVEAFPLAQTLG